MVADSSEQDGVGKEGGERKRYKGAMLFRALVRASRGKLLRMGLLLVGKGAANIFQVRLDKISFRTALFTLGRKVCRLVLSQFPRDISAFRPVTRRILRPRNRGKTSAYAVGTSQSTVL